MRHPGDFRTAVTDLNLTHASPGVGPLLRVLNLDAAECFLGLCDERRRHDRYISGVDALPPCRGCGTLRGDWDTTHRLYRLASQYCPACAADYLDADDAYRRSQDL